MARFGRSFVAAATQPAYMEGLFTAAQQIGAEPAKRKAAQERAELAQGLFGFEQAVKEGKVSPELYSTMASAYGGMINPRNEEYLTKRLGAIESEQQSRVNRQAAADLARLSGEVTKLELSTATPAEREKQLDEIRIQMDQIIEGSTLDPSIIGQIIPDAQRTALDIDARRKQKRLLDDKIDSLPFEREKREHIQEMWQQQTESGQLNIDLQKLRVAAAQSAAIERHAKQVDKTVFLKLYPDKGKVFDAVEREMKTEQLRLEALEQQVNDAKFNFTAESLSSLGIPEEKAKQLIEISKTNPSVAKTSLLNMIKAASASKKPSAALGKMFEEVALGHIAQLEGWSIDGGNMEKYGQARASSLALEAANMYISQNEDIEKALAVIYGYQAMGKEKGRPISTATTPSTGRRDYASEMAERDAQAAGK